MLWFSRIKNMVSKIMHSSVSHYLTLIKHLFIYNDLQYFDWPNIVAHSPARLMYIEYELVALVHRSIQVTTIKIGYIQLCQGFEC